MRAVFLATTPRDIKEEGGLLSKMINAMPLEKGEGVRILFDQENEDKIWQEIEGDLYLTRPRALVSFGAFATHLILSQIRKNERRERLASVHGKKFILTLPARKGGSALDIACFPVFHPDFLRINTNMKRTAWMDLAKSD